MIYACLTEKYPLQKKEAREKQSRMAYGILLYGMEREYGCTSLPTLEKMPGGKPYFPKQRGIQFNLSHCSKGVLCAIGEKEIGVDIESVVSYKKKLAERVCHGRELELFLGKSEKEKSMILTRIWVLKEAYLKYLGTGITRDLRNLDFSDCMSDRFSQEGLYFGVWQEESWCMAVCMSDVPKEVQWVLEKALLRFF